MMRHQNQPHGEEVKEYVTEKGEQAKDTIRRNFGGGEGMINAALILEAIGCLALGASLLFRPSWIVPGFVSEAKSGLSISPIVRCFAILNMLMAMVAGTAFFRFDWYHKEALITVFLVFHMLSLGDMALLGWSQSGAFRYSPVFYHLPMALLTGAVVLNNGKFRNAGNTGGGVSAYGQRRKMY